MRKIWIGTSGYNYADWKDVFYPEQLVQKDWLHFYAEQFDTVELNATFYGSFSRAVYQKWAAQTGSSFRFSIKGSRFITHIKRLHDIDDSVHRFFQGAEGLGGKLQVVLWQFPANFTLEKDPQEKLERLQVFFSLLPKTIHHVCEFRHESWFSDYTFALLSNYNIGLVINQSSVFPTIEKVTSSIVYIRFHGPGALYSSSYTDEQLQMWAKKIKAMQKNHDVYCYFNNDFHG